MVCRAKLPLSSGEYIGIHPLIDSCILSATLQTTQPRTEAAKIAPVFITHHIETQMIPDELSEPLSMDELNELESMLAGDTYLPHCEMSVSMLDGFLTCLVIGPDPVNPSEWLPILWGEEYPSAMEESALERLLGLVTRLSNSIAMTMDQAPGSFEPIIGVYDEGELEIPIVDEWCAGFETGIALRAESWKGIVDKDLGEMLTPIMIASELDSEAQPAAEYQKICSSLQEAIAPAVIAIYHFWKEQGQVPGDATVH